MRISPVMLPRNTRTNKANNSQTKFERNNTSVDSFTRVRKHHQYTGVASVDLAYASMTDNAIARDLKLMGLI